jgi:excisionase family DNA binding protein
MASYNQQITPFVLNYYISVQVASAYSGYSLQYLRRLLRKGKLEGIKIGQLWLVDKGAFDICLEQVQNMTDHRFGPKQFSMFRSMAPIKHWNL